MQKKLIALAVAGMMAAPVVMAQSNVTIYGRVDMGFSNYGSSTAPNVGSKSGIDSVKDPSYIAFRGTEDLGNGLKVGFNLQERINPDRGEFAGSGRRDNFLFLSGNFGTIAAGRLTTPQDKLLGSTDPFGSAGISGYSGSYILGANLLAGANVTRLDNTVAYISPSFSGLTVTAAYTFSAARAESLENEGGDLAVFAISPVYSNGPLMVGLNYHQVTLNNKGAANDDSKEKYWDLAGSYDFGVAKLSAAYGQVKLDAAGAALDEKVKQWFVGASIPVGEAGKVMVSYGQTDMDKTGVSDAEIDRWALGYTHSLSKRTTVYALYGSVDLGRQAAAELNITGLSDSYERGIGVGIQHTF